MTIKHDINSFDAGEFGAEMVSRYDLPKYQSACKTLKNFIPSVQGGVRRRKGLRYKYNTKNLTQKSRLISFIFNETDNIVIEMGNLYLRFIQGETQITSAGSPYEVVSPYTTAQLPIVKYRQIGDLVYFSHPDVRPYVLKRIANNNWTFSPVEITYGPVEKENTNKGITAYVSSGTHTEGGACVITFSSATLSSAMVGWYFKFVKGGSTVFAKMTGFTNSTTGTFLAVDDLSAIVNTGNATYQWSLPAWTSTNGFPIAITFHEQRLVFGGSKKYPLTIWGSSSGGAIEDFEAGINADDAFVFELAGYRNSIQWLKSDGLYIACGTLGGIGFIGSGNNLSLTPTNVNARISSSYGSSYVEPILLNNFIIYAPSNGNMLLELHYDETLLRYKSIPVTAQNVKILKNVEYIESTEQPDLCAYCVSQGKIIALNRDEQNNILALYSIETDGLIESVAVIPTADNDLIWCVVNRGGSRYIEVFNETTDEIFADSAVIYSGTATKTITGLTHLKNKNVLVASKISSGFFWVNEYTEYTVDNDGVLTIEETKEAVTYAVIGLKYDSILETMPLVVQTQYGNSFGKGIKIVEAQVILQETGVIQIGTPKGLKTFEKPKAGRELDKAPNKYGIDYPEMLSVQIGENYTKSATLKIVSNSIFNAIIHGITFKLDIEK